MLLARIVLGPKSGSALQRIRFPGNGCVSSALKYLSKSGLKYLGQMEAHGTAIDGSIAVPALLYPDETLLGDQDGVGLYEGYVYVYSVVLGFLINLLEITRPQITSSVAFMSPPID